MADSRRRASTCQGLRIVAARFAVAVLLATLLAPANAAGAATGAPLRILFVGNSLTYWTDVPARLQKAAQAIGRAVTIESVAFPAFSLEDHWADGRALAQVRRGWDLVVLQQGTSALPESRAQLIDYARRFERPIREAGARPVIYMSWPTRDRWKDFPAAIASHRAAASAIDADLIPAGEAWLRALAADQRLPLYADAIHPTSLGGDLIVLTACYALFRGERGGPNLDAAQGAAIARELGIPAERRENFLDVARRAVEEPLRVP